MNITEIKDLLEKYFEGEITLIEEARLKDFFMQDKVPPELATYAGLFRYFSDQQKEEIVNPGFEERFLSQIRDTPVIPLTSGNRRNYYLLSIAAGILLLCGLIFTFRHDIIKNPGSSRLKDTYADPAAAYMEAKRALLLLSANLNTGLDQMNNLNSFQKGVENIEKFSVFYKYQQLNINPDEVKSRP
jgi:hypothetical protein